MSRGKKVDRQTRVFKLCDDEATEYAILSHRWIDSTEINYEEMVDLGKANSEERDEIRQRPGYKKIVDTCEQARRDKYEWVWIDTCCIDKRSSAELSEVINSMYRWYQNARVCYAYLHDVDKSSFPTTKDDQAYPTSNGWPEWFSRGWTLQEMIAPSNLLFFNGNWTYIGDKKMLALILTRITRVPEYILKEGLVGNRPCVAQIMSWAAKRTTTRLEDRAYSLMGLLDVNMPMLYGEGKKAFHRLQLEIIRTSNDQSIFAWGHMRTGSVLADGPHFFEACSELELLNHDEFINFLKKNIPEVELPSIDQDYFATFPTTNRGIHIWMLLLPHRNMDSVFRAYLPCRDKSRSLVTIDLALWNSNYYRYSTLPHSSPGASPQFRQVYLRYQDISCNITFEIDDNAVTKNGFICLDEYPSKITENTLTLTTTSPLYTRTYSERQGNGRFAVAFGQCFGQDWIQLMNNPPDRFTTLNTEKMVVRGAARSQSMADVPSRGDCRGHVWVHHMCLPDSTWIIRTSRVVWERSKIAVQMEVFRDPGFQNDLYSGWMTFNIEVSGFVIMHMDCYDDHW